VCVIRWCKLLTFKMVINMTWLLKDVSRRMIASASCVLSIQWAYPITIKPIIYAVASL